MSERFDKLVALLKELFQLDQPDLDFGFYRVMHAKSAEITKFLEQDLLPQVKAAFAEYQPANKAAIERDLDNAIGQAQALGADPETLPKVKELRTRLADEAVDIDALEADVYDRLYSFFRRTTPKVICSRSASTSLEYMPSPTKAKKSNSTGPMDGSDCVPDSARRVVWKSENSEVASVNRDGWVRAISPGVFRAQSQIGTDTLRTEGFVLPQGWQVRIEPKSVRTNVGDTVAFMVRAYTASGEQLPVVPFSLYTPEFLAIDEDVAKGRELPRDRKPLTDKWSYQQTIAPGVFRATRAGATSITGSIGGQSVAASLVIAPVRSGR